VIAARALYEREGLVFISYLMTRVLRLKGVEQWAQIGSFKTRGSRRIRGIGRRRRSGRRR